MPQTEADRPTGDVTGQTMQDASDALESMRRLIREAVRQVLIEELLVLHAATFTPILNALIEIQQSLKLVLDGQRLVELALSDLTTRPDDEPWRESLD